MADETADENKSEGGLGVVAEDETANLRSKLEAVEQDKKETYERLLRTAADLDNVRKRARKDVDDARLQAREQALKEILPGIDNLERALAASSKDTSTEGILEGIKLVLRQFQTSLERLEVKPFESVGQPFDPTRHEAISQVETGTQPPGTVVTEMQRGYTIGARLLRPALVSVAKPASSQSKGE